MRNKMALLLALAVMLLLAGCSYPTLDEALLVDDVQWSNAMLAQNLVLDTVQSVETSRSGETLTATVTLGCKDRDDFSVTSTRTFEAVYTLHPAWNKFLGQSEGLVSGDIYWVLNDVYEV